LLSQQGYIYLVKNKAKKLNTFVERVLLFSGFIDEYKEQFITNIK